jgi:hypothetical protein
VEGGAQPGVGGTDGKSALVPDWLGGHRTRQAIPTLGVTNPCKQ